MASALLVAATASAVASAGSAPKNAGSLPKTVAVRTGITSIHVVGNELVDGQDGPVELLGLNRSGTEYACAQGWGIFDGPTGPVVIRSMRSWSINVVRIPLNEDCWLGVDVAHAHSGAIYRNAIVRYVKQLAAQGIVAILDLHWSASGASPALGQQQMPDASHTIAFWRSVARTFRSRASVAYELYNEPHDVSWQCWRDGCTTSAGWRAVGMQTLIDTVRGTGASQPIIVDGLAWANDLSGWLTHPLVDPKHQLVAGFQLYPWNSCVTAQRWTKVVATVARSVPVITTEVGENDCKGTFVTTFLDWAAPRHISALVWTWNDNQGCLSLIRNPDSGATSYGTTVLRDFKRLSR